MTAPTQPPAAERKAAGPGSAAAPPAAHAEPSRQVRSARSRRLEHLASEGGLLLLSLMLALMVWFIVRGLVETTATLTVRVQALAPPGTLVTVLEDVEVSFRGPRGKVEEAVTLLEERGKVIALEVKQLQPTTQRRDLGLQDQYRLPFRKDLLDGELRLPKGEVVRLEQGRPVRIVVPAPKVPEDRRAQITVEPDRPLLDAPAGTLSDEIEADPIDVKPLLDQPGRPHRIPLTFERWRQGAGDRTLAPEVLRRRAGVAIRGVWALVQVEVTATQALANALETVVKRDWTVIEITPPAGNADGFAGPLLVSENSPRLDRVTFTGLLTSTQEALKELEERRDGWRWILFVLDEDLPEPGKPAKEVQARLCFRALSDRLHDLEARGSLKFEPFSVPVKVVSTKR